jgi:preprotein translocase subunit SecF
MFELFNPKWRIPFIRISRVTLIVSTILMILSVVVLFKPGLDFALDFTGGTVVELEFEQEANVEQIETLLQEAGYAGSRVQSFGSTRDILIRLRPEPNQDVEDADVPVDAGEPAGIKQNAGERVHRLLADKGLIATVKRNESVGPQIGKELAEDGIIGVVFVMVGIMIYVALRYEWRFGLAALAGDVHDTLLTAGFIVLAGMEFDLQALAALLTVAGYSINDKIVIFDRIREMFRTTSRVTPAETIDLACSDTLSRTIITGLTTIMALTVLFFLGGETLKDFSLILIVGILIGTYSSILFAAPLLLHLGVTKQDLMPKTRDDAALARRP